MSKALRASASGSTLVFEGFTEIARDFKEAGKKANKEFRDSLKPIGRVVATTGAQIAKAKGLYDTGQLTRKLMLAGAVQVNQKGVFVTAKATRGGYPYPSIYEFGGRAVSLKRKGPGMTAVTNRSKRQGSRGVSGASLASAGQSLGEFGEYGPRAFLYPALVETKDERERMTYEWLGTFLQEHGF